MRKEKLLNAIEMKRKKMIENALHYGFTHPKTVLYSKELDHLLNKVK
ncbi:aspartyl-phosphate phosphatase Spo0E family protein [Anaerobacillus arseniciselenatis]|nr:aspartyl-phosphate phosphatase Spo0E family protein [Anaerobacillus arseniciselenatis]